MVVMLVVFILPSFINSCSLLNARVVALPFNLGLWWEAKNALGGLPVCCVSRHWGK